MSEALFLSKDSLQRMEYQPSRMLWFADFSVVLELKQLSVSIFLVNLFFSRHCSFDDVGVSISGPAQLIAAI